MLKETRPSLHVLISGRQIHCKAALTECTWCLCTERLCTEPLCSVGPVCLGDYLRKCSSTSLNSNCPSVLKFSKRGPKYLPEARVSRSCEFRICRKALQIHEWTGGQISSLLPTSVADQKLVPESNTVGSTRACDARALWRRSRLWPTRILRRQGYADCSCGESCTAHRSIC